MLAIQNLSKSYGADQSLLVLRNVEMALECGGFCALIGTSGSGKTALMNLIGLLDPSYGWRYIHRRAQ